MNKQLRKGIAAVFGAVIGAISPVAADMTDTNVQKAVEAYLYGYPLITFDFVRQQNTNVAVSGPEQAPMGQLIKMRNYPAVDNHCCAAPNADTLYTMAWFDLSKEPWLVSMPDMGNRYYILPFLDGWSEVFHVASQPLSGGKALTFALTGPNWKGTLPTGVTELKSATAMVWMLGRIYSTGTKEDYDAVHTLQDGFNLRPLSSWGKGWTPPKGQVDPDVDMTTSVRAQVNALDTDAYFDRLAALMAENPPHPKDGEMVALLSELGIEPGQDFDATKFGGIEKELLATVPKRAQLRMALRMKQTDTTNGWLYFTKGVGNWGTDYELRAMANLLGPGWNRPQDAIYPISQADAKGHDYDGAKHSYVIRFEKGDLPPANGFWSLTMYDKDLFFVPNSINRYAIGSHTTLTKDDDGAIEVLLQPEAPRGDNKANWLPAPQGPFKLVLRLYDPSGAAPSILDGSWTPPPVEKRD
jgi:hypothetical protein